jgi:hypothetical protein
MTLDENERSIHDALCVMRALYQKRFLVPGGGAPEAEAAYQLGKVSAARDQRVCYCCTACGCCVCWMTRWCRRRWRHRAVFPCALGRSLRRWR